MLYTVAIICVFQVGLLLYVKLERWCSLYKVIDGGLQIKENVSHACEMWGACIGLIILSNENRRKCPQSRS